MLWESGKDSGQEKDALAGSSAAWPSRDLSSYSPLPTFGPLTDQDRPTMPSADFCIAITRLPAKLSPDFETRRRSPEVSSTAFAAHPPNLLVQVLDSRGLRGHPPARPTWAASYSVLVHRVAVLLRASFRPRLTAKPLRFAIPSSLSDWEEDFHLQAVEHARHTDRIDGSAVDGYRAATFPGRRRRGAPAADARRRSWDRRSRLDDARSCRPGRGRSAGRR
jgi:hypothetical protein